ncbi:MAG: hypothetical protein ACRDVN_12445 [Jiangellaceae bacterium]
MIVDASTLRGVFDRVLAVREFGPDAREVADRLATAHGHQAGRDHERVAGITAT